MIRRDFLLCASFVILPQSALAQPTSECGSPDEAGDALVTEAKIARFSPRARIELVRAIVGGWGAAAAAGLITPTRVQHFMAQIATETGGFVTIDENLSYSAPRLRKVWPKRFPTDALALAYAKNPQKLAEFVYGGRLGNTSPGDGYKYRGSGFIQLTGKANFASKTASLGLNPSAVDFPDQIRKPKNGFDAALKFWNSVGANAIADAEQLNTLRKRINGGLHGIADTQIWLARARRIFKAGPVGPDESDAADNEELAAMQARLQELGYLKSGPEEADSPAATITAMQEVREERGLTLKDVSGVNPRLGQAVLFDEDMLYTLTDPDDRISEERDNAPS